MLESAFPHAVEWVRANSFPNPEGLPMTRAVLVTCALCILGPFGADSDLRRCGLRLAARGGKSAKKRAVVAIARKLSVLLHKLWRTGEVYEPLRNSLPAEERKKQLA